MWWCMICYRKIKDKRDKKKITVSEVGVNEQHNVREFKVKNSKMFCRLK